MSFAHMTAEQLKQKYDILFLEWAQDLHDRAKVRAGNHHYEYLPLLMPPPDAHHRCPCRVSYAASRAQDILELGFWEALNKAVEHSKSEWYRLESQRPAPDNHMFPHWRGAFWRPLVDAKCDA